MTTFLCLKKHYSSSHCGPRTFSILLVSHYIPYLEWTFFILYKHVTLFRRNMTKYIDASKIPTNQPTHQPKYIIIIHVHEVQPYLVFWQSNSTVAVTLDDICTRNFLLSLLLTSALRLNIQFNLLFIIWFVIAWIQKPSMC